MAETHFSLVCITRCLARTYTQVQSSARLNLLIEFILVAFIPKLECKYSNHVARSNLKSLLINQDVDLRISRADLFCKVRTGESTIMVFAVSKPNSSNGRLIIANEIQMKNHSAYSLHSSTTRLMNGFSPQDYRYFINSQLFVTSFRGYIYVHSRERLVNKE